MTFRAFSPLRFPHVFFTRFEPRFCFLFSLLRYIDILGFSILLAKPSQSGL